MLSYNFNWSIIWTEPYGQWMLQGIWVTVRLGLICWFIALALGIIIGTFRVTPFKPRCVVLQGLSADQVHPLIPRLAERDRITVVCTGMDVDTIIKNLRGELW